LQTLRLHIRHGMKKYILPIAVLAAVQLNAADWPQYRGPFQNGSTIEPIKTQWGGALQASWKTPTPNGFSSFAVADGVAATQYAKDGKETVVVLNATSGRVLWAQVLNDAEYGHTGGNAGARGNQGGDGPRSTPSIDGELLYVFSSDFDLICFNLKDGTTKWNGTGFDATVTHSADFADAFEFDVSADSERVRVAYVQDGDADLGAPEDQEIFIVDYVLEDFSDPDAPPAWHAPFQLTINSVPDTRPRFAASSDTHQSGVWLSSALFWDRDGELVQLNNDQTGNFMSVLNDALFPNNADFGVVAYGDELLLHWPDLNDGQPDIAARFLTSGGWSETIFLTQDAASENEVSILVQPNNRFGIIFNRNQANPVQTDLTWLEYAGDTDLAFATPAITFEVSEFDPNQLDVKVNVLNTGGEYVNQVDVSLYERDPTNGGSLVQSVQVNLMGGEQKAVAFAYSIPQTVIEDTLFATIDSGLAITESDENNNTASLKALRPNLAITRATWSVNQSDEYVFSVDVENDSMLATASNDATFELGASVLRNTTVPTLASGETTQLVFTIPSTELFTSTDASITIRADASAEIEESDEFDNDFRLLIGTGSPSTGFVDTDNDGFDDNYELEKFGDLTRDGAGDKDGDGATDLHEFLAGTDPDNPNSLLEVIVTVDQGGNPIVTWEIQPGLTYRLQTTTSLGDPNAWTALGADRPNNGQSPVMEHVTDTSAAPPETRFYRVQIVP